MINTHARTDASLPSWVFVARINQGAIGRRGLESLITAGAFDTMRPEECTTNSWRARLFAGIDTALAYSQRAWSDKQRGQNDLFGQATAEEAVGEDELPLAEAWTQAEIWRRKKLRLASTSQYILWMRSRTQYQTSIVGRHDHPEINPGDT